MFDEIMEIIHLALVYRVLPPAIIIGDQFITANPLNRFTRPDPEIGWEKNKKFYQTKFTYRKMIEIA